MRPRSLVIAAALVASGALVPAVASSPTNTAAGCDPKRPAVAYYPGGKLLFPQPRNAPIPCASSTGFGSAESHIAVTASGAVVFTPAVVPSGTLGTGELDVPVGRPSQHNANPAGIAISRNNGQSWKLVRPSGVTWNPTDHGDYVDPVTDRLYFEDYGPIPLAPSLGPGQEGPAHINVSADEGVTWTHTTIPAVVLPENPRFTSAVAPQGQPQPHGYPRVTYFCANVNVGFVSPAIAGRTCYRSMDGGLVWKLTSVILSGSAPIHSECSTNGEKYSAIDGYYPQPAPDGSLYLMVACGTQTFLARSQDEGATFPVLHLQSQPITLPVPNGGVPELRIDSRGVMYLMWSLGATGGGLPGGATTKLGLRISKDSGRTWGPSIDLTPPKVTTMRDVSWELHGPGEIAAGILGRRAGQVGYDGLLVASRNILSDRPVIYSGILNDPRRPLLFSADVTGSGYILLPGLPPIAYPPPFGFNFAGNDFIGTTYAPDGTPWASFTQDCGPAPDAPQCVKQQDQTRGIAGRLMWR